MGVITQVCAHDDGYHPKRVCQHEGHPVQREPPALAVFTAAGDDNAGWHQDCICYAAKQPMNLEQAGAMSGRKKRAS